MCADKGTKEGNCYKTGPKDITRECSSRNWIKLIEGETIQAMKLS